MRNWITWLCLLALVLGTGTCSEGGSRTGNAADIPLAMDTIGPEGGTIKVDMPGSLLDGAEVTVAAGALFEDVEFELIQIVDQIVPDPALRALPRSATLRVEPLDQFTLIPVEVRLPVNMSVSPGIGDQVLNIALSRSSSGSVFYSALSDADFGDGFGTVSSSLLADFQLGSQLINVDSSGLYTHVPTASGLPAKHVVTANSADQIELSLELSAQFGSANSLIGSEGLNFRVRWTNLSTMANDLFDPGVGEFAYDDNGTPLDATDDIHTLLHTAAESPVTQNPGEVLMEVEVYAAGHSPFADSCIASPICVPIPYRSDPFEAVP
ncbi:MAG: hypothetical protein KDH09_18760 [Chrysiogenetes bacterium]|nr:hypothetical protein [Chrysiogenetes bacterium]